VVCFLEPAIQEARQDLAEGGSPIGSVVVHHGKIIGRGHNRSVQQGSAICRAIHFVRHGIPFRHPVAMLN